MSFPRFCRGDSLCWSLGTMYAFLPEPLIYVFFLESFELPFFFNTNVMEATTATTTTTTHARSGPMGSGGRSVRSRSVTRGSSAMTRGGAERSTARTHAMCARSRSTHATGTRSRAVGRSRAMARSRAMSASVSRRGREDGTMRAATAMSTVSRQATNMMMLL